VYFPANDLPRGKAYNLARVDWNAPFPTLNYTLNPASGSLYSPTGTTPLNYCMYAMGMNLLADGRLFLTGGSAAIDNYSALTKTFFATPNQGVPTLPVADAGPNVAILSRDWSTTVITGTASDPDGDPVTYRWLEGETELYPSQPVGADGKATLDLSAVPRLAAGNHTLTLEVSSGSDTVTAYMELTVENSAPLPAATGGGTFQVNTPVTLAGQVSDYDGDLITYQWIEGTTVLTSDQVYPATGGEPVNIPEFTIASLPVGAHDLTLVVSDGVNSPVAQIISVTIISATTAPTLAPVANKTILWPPNKRLVKVILKANAVDNRGGSITLSVEPIVCSETLEEGKAAWTAPKIDQKNGSIVLKLRADRLLNGPGRTYTIAIKATDQSGNFSVAPVRIIVPRYYGWAHN